MTLVDLVNRLTPEQHDSFERYGYIIIMDALDQQTLSGLDQAFELVERRIRTLVNASKKDRLLVLDLLGLDRRLYELIDHPTVFPKVCELLGWNIQIYHTHLCSAPPIDGIAQSFFQHYIHSGNPSLNTARPCASAGDTWAWHRDSGQVNFDLGPWPHPRISLKVAYFLSDTSAAASGNLYVVPGTHREPELVSPEDMRSKHQLPQALAVLAPRGAAVIFDRRLVHSGSPNFGQHKRRVLFYGYSFRWFRPRDEMSVGNLEDEFCPIRRQLLGQTSSAYGYSSPSKEDVPLRQWMIEQGILSDEDKTGFTGRKV